MKTKKSNEKLILGLAVITLLVLVFNSYQIGQMGGSASLIKTTTTGNAVSNVVPQGAPSTYGEELGISFDDVSPYDKQKADSTIKVMADIDKSTTLSEEDKDRYINILFTLGDGTSCEYCCGAKSVIFENGDPACGCAHSYAMRGLAKYLITEHGNEYTDEEILEEVVKWKVLFFPGQMAQKPNILEQNNVETSYFNLGSNKYRGIEKGTAGGGMVGGC